MKCDDKVLIELLDDTEFAAESEATMHLGTCPRCQARIEQLAADNGTWQEVVVALDKDDADQRLDQSGSMVIAIDTELAGDMPLQVDAVSLDFLDPPSHPEMLGRIGRYEVERLIGAGGMGIVLKTFDTELHRPVAVKVLAPHLAHHGGARQRFAREAQSAAAVVHENVVPIHNVDTAGKLPFIVMQYVAGDSLQGRVDQSGPLSTRETLRIGAQIASGLAAAHEQGLVHRDVKPGNVLMEESIDRVLISDFGLARAADDASVTRSGVIAGTPHYMSPEQARGDSIDSRSDLFGLGSVLYFMCTGRPPFRATGAMGVLNRICNDEHRPVDDVNDMVPGPLADLIDELLSKSPNKRPATAQEVANRLTSLLHDSRGRNRFRRRGKQRAWKAVAVMAAGLVVGAMLIAFAIHGRGTSERFSSVGTAKTGSTNTPEPDGFRATDALVGTAASPTARLFDLNAPAPTELREPESELFGFQEREVVRRDEIVRDDAFDQMLEATQLEVGAFDMELPPNETVLSDAYQTWDDEFEALQELVDEVEQGSQLGL